MQEFSAVTASSYDAESLAPLLTEKSAEGWTVVSIVAAGTGIIAYLSRPAHGAEPDAQTSTSAAAALVADEPAGGAEPEPAGDVAAGSSWSGGDAGAAPTLPGDVAAGAATVAGADAVEAAAPSIPAVSEPAGWGEAPESTGDDQSLADLASGVEPADDTGGTDVATTVTEAPGQDAPEGAADAVTAAAGGVTDTAAAAADTAHDTAAAAADTAQGAAAGYGASAHDTAAAAADTAHDTAAAAADTAQGAAAGYGASAAAAEPAASTVPAGWYSDPSGRYELRYWDGNQWTEHVSRAGQQYTDPPVA